MAVRSFLFQSSLLVVLTALTLPSLLAGDPPRSGLLSRDGLLLTLTVLEVVWIGLLLPLALPGVVSVGRLGKGVHLAAAAAGAIVLSLPIVLLAARSAGIAPAFVVGSQAAVVAVAALAVPCLSGHGRAAGRLYVPCALLVGLLPPFIGRVAEDILGAAQGGLLANVSPVSGIVRAYPDRSPVAVLALIGAAAAIAWLVRFGLFRRAAGPVAASMIAALLIGSAVRPPPPAAPDLPEVVRVTSPLEGVFRPGGWGAASVRLRNGSAAPIDGDMIVRVGGIDYPRSIELRSGETGGVDLLFYLPDERPAFQAHLRAGGRDLPLPELEEALLRLFRPLHPGKAAIGWAGPIPDPARKIVEGISATQISIPDSIGSGWEAIGALDVVVVAQRVGDRLARALQEWQVHGGSVLCLSQESSVALGAPLPRPGEGIAVRRRGRGRIGTLDLGGEEGRGVLFEKARRLLRMGVRPSPPPPDALRGLFGSPRYAASRRRIAAGWAIAVAALGVAASGLVFRRFRLAGQAALSAAAVATLPWVVPFPVVADGLTVLHGSDGSDVLARTRVVRIAALAPRSALRIPADPEAVPVPAGRCPGLSLSAEGEWTVPLSRGSEAIFLRRGLENLPGVITFLGTGEAIGISNRTSLGLGGTILIVKGRGYPLGSVGPGEKAFADHGSGGLPLRQVIPLSLGMDAAALLDSGLLTPETGPLLAARIRFPHDDAHRIPGSAPGESRPALLVVR